MTDEERAKALKLRRLNNRPWHSPPHRDEDTKKWFIITAACYGHKSILNSKRLFEIEQDLGGICDKMKSNMAAWCVMPNHYHFLVETDMISNLRKELGRMHGRTSREWNLLDNCAGRKVWYNCAERTIKSTRHYWATINYIHHNPVKHGYVKRWTDWEFSSAYQYIRELGRDKVKQLWLEYPVLDYGEKWDM